MVVLFLPSQTRTADFALLSDSGNSGAEFEGVAAVGAGAASRLLIEYPERVRFDNF